jgi:hypothetical protein
MISLFPRNHLLSGVLLLVACVLATSAAAEPEISSTSNGISGIEIANSGSIPEGIVAELKSNSADGMLPYAIVVRNTSSLSVTGLAIRYEIRANGNVTWRNFLYLSHLDVASADSTPIVGPRGSVVITPYHKLNEQLMGTGSSVSLTDRDIDYIERLTGFLNSANQVTISIDSVIRSDGTIVGPDHSLTFRGFQRQISAYTDFRNELLGRFAEGGTDADIIAWLQQVESQRSVHPVNEPPDPGIMLVKLRAQEYLGFIENQGRQYAWDTLKGATPEKALSQFYKVHQGGSQ